MSAMFIGSVYLLKENITLEGEIVDQTRVIIGAVIYAFALIALRFSQNNAKATSKNKNSRNNFTFEKLGV